MAVWCAAAVNVCMKCGCQSETENSPCVVESESASENVLCGSSEQRCQTAGAASVVSQCTAVSVVVVVVVAIVV